MPELPDVQMFKEYVDATSLHKPIEDVEVPLATVVQDLLSVLIYLLVCLALV